MPEVYTNYTYTTGTKNLAANGSLKYFKISGRWDSVGNSQYNVQTYSYNNEPNGYPTYKSNNIDQNYQYGSTVYNKNGETINYLFNNKHKLYI